MSDKILQTIDPEGDLKEQLQAIRDNFLTLQKDSLKGAAQVLALTALSSDQSVTSATPVGIGLKTSITTSGGLVMLFGVASLETNGVANATTTVRLTLDDETKGEQFLSLVNLYSGVACIPWAGAVGAGVHTIDLTFGIDAGISLVHGDLDNQTYLLAVEFII